jgi:type VI protein secretion system component VasK
MQWIGLLSLSPIVCIIALVIVAFLQDIRWRIYQKRHPQKRMRRIGAAYALGAAFLCFSTFYHPRLELASTAQIRQQEQDDEDDQGDPESPLRHLLRQLRRIRRGERVDRLVWRLE